MNIIASLLLATGICLILRSLLKIIPYLKQKRQDREDQQ